MENLKTLAKELLNQLPKDAQVNSNFERWDADISISGKLDGKAYSVRLIQSDKFGFKIIDVDKSNENPERIIGMIKSIHPTARITS